MIDIPIIEIQYLPVSFRQEVLSIHSATHPVFSDVTPISLQYSEARERTIWARHEEVLRRTISPTLSRSTKKRSEQKEIEELKGLLRSYSSSLLMPKEEFAKSIMNMRTTR